MTLEGQKRRQCQITPDIGFYAFDAWCDAANVCNSYQQAVAWYSYMDGERFVVFI